jgi:glycosyltransferase involved in cell wall biosynthesis
VSRAETLFLAPAMPAEGGNGLAMRAGLLLEGLSRAAPVRVLVVPVFGDPGPPSALADRLASSVEVLPLDPNPDPVADLTARLGTPEGRARAGALHPLPTLCRTATPAASKAVAEAARRVALVVAMRLYLAPLLDALLDRDPRPALVLDVDDVESLTQRGLGQLEEASRFERLERVYLPLLDHVVACSRDDADHLAGLHRLRSTVVVPNAIRPPAPASGRLPAHHDLVFVGNLSYGPNADGARWLCEEVLPLLDGSTVALVGSQPGPDVLELAADRRVTVAADVPDVGPWYRSASVAVAPLRAGGGTRIKVLEAFAHRRAVVATTAGAGGLGLAGSDGPIVTADTADAFAAACRRLLDQPPLASSLAERGAEIVLTRNSVDAVAPLVEALALDTLRR